MNNRFFEFIQFEKFTVNLITKIVKYIIIGLILVILEIISSFFVSQMFNWNLPFSIIFVSVFFIFFTHRFFYLKFDREDYNECDYVAYFFAAISFISLLSAPQEYHRTQITGMTPEFQKTFDTTVESTNIFLETHCKNTISQKIPDYIFRCNKAKEIALILEKNKTQVNSKVINNILDNEVMMPYLISWGHITGFDRNHEAFEFLVQDLGTLRRKLEMLESEKNNSKSGSWTQIFTNNFFRSVMYYFGFTAFLFKIGLVISKFSVARDNNKYLVL